MVQWLCWCWNWLYIHVPLVEVCRGKWVFFFFSFWKPCWLFCKDAEALWESDWSGSLKKMLTSYYSHLYPKSPLVKYQPKISPAWAFHKPFQAFLMTVTVLCLDSLSHWVWDPLYNPARSSLLPKSSFYGSFTAPLLEASVYYLKHQTTSLPYLKFFSWTSCYIIFCFAKSWFNHTLDTYLAN